MTTNNNISFSTIDYLIIGTALLFSIIAWVYAGIEFSGLPETIPSHFNHKGEADDYSGKSVLWVISGIFTVLIIVIFFIAKNPRLHNIQLKSKEANFRSVAIFMPYIGIIHLIAIYSTIQSAHGTFSWPEWMLPSIIGLTAVFLAVMFIILYKNKKS